MAKELPYFRFYASEWIEGNITLEDEITQGLFINICAWYWKKDCNINKKFVEKRIIKNNQILSNCLTKLIDANIIKLASDLLTIDFLDLQYKKLNKISLKRSRAGQKGGKASVKQMLKPGLSYKDKDKDKDNNIEKREQIFKSEIKSKIGEFFNHIEFDKNEATKFFNYWSEPNKGKTKLRFELQKTWDTKKRIVTWMGNKKKGY